MGSISTAKTYEALAEQIETLLQNPDGAASQIQDEALRRRLSESARKLSVAVEEPRDSIRRLSYTHLQLPLAVAGVEAGIFDALDSESRVVTCGEIAEKTGVNYSLLKRLLRYYQALDMITQVDDDGFKANNVTHMLSSEYHAKTLKFGQKITAPASVKLPEWLKSIQYKDPTGIKPSAWGFAFETEQHPYDWMGSNPWALDLAIAHMRIQREGRPVFFDALNFEEHFAQGATDETVLFVDMGGSTGPQSMNLRTRFPDLPGRVIVQDRPEIVEKAKAATDGSKNIEAVVYDFFEPQNIKGARTYYLRNILHAWDDDKCVEILLNVKAGLEKESVILIDETVLPERDTKPRGAQHDMEMMLCVGAKERTQAEFQKLLEDAGLVMREVVKYDPEYEDSVIIAALA